MQTGIGAAIKEGRYTKYPGVQFRRETGKWRVQFKYQAVRHRVQGQFALEADAARAHDACAPRLSGGGPSLRAFSEPSRSLPVGTCERTG